MLHTVVMNILDTVQTFKFKRHDANSRQIKARKPRADLGVNCVGRLGWLGMNSEDVDGRLGINQRLRSGGRINSLSQGC